MFAHVRSRSGCRPQVVVSILLTLFGLAMALPASANVKTVNGISAEVNMDNAQRGVAYSQFILPSGGGGAPYTFEMLSGPLPEGFTLSAAGELSGTNCSAANGAFPFEVRVTSSTGTIANFTLTNKFSVQMTAGPSGACDLTVGPLPTTGTVGAAYTGTATASGGTAPYTWSIVAGSLPAGLVLDTSTGVVSGTPTTAGTYSFTLKVADSGGAGGITSYTVAIAAAGITLTPTSVPAGKQNLAYATQNISASGGAAPYTYLISAGALPTGMTLASDGTLSGTPAVAGTFNFTVQATDNAAGTGTRPYSMTVAAAPAITVDPAALPDALQAIAYGQAITATGGTASYGYTITAGALPAGLTLASNGTLSGTPTVSGTFNFTVTATDADTYTGSRAYSLVVTATPTIALTPATLPDGSQGLAYSQSITASGGTAPYGYAITAGSLPAGLMLASNGTLSGTPTVSGTFSFTVTATDANGYTGSQAYTLVLAAAPTIAISPTTLPDGSQGLAYSQTVIASGGTAAYTYTVTAGALPAGLTLVNGVLSGTPTVSGTFNFTLTATDANSYTGTRAYTLAISAEPTLTISPTSLPGALQNIAYGPQSITASGGTAPYSFAVTTGTLPAGLTLTSGVLSGTPTATGTFNFTVTVTDANGYTSAQAYSLVVTAAPTITISPTTLPGALQNIAYGPQSITASSGTAPYSFAVTTGTLPAGLTLTSGVLSGTPTASGTFNFTVTVTDANGYTSAQAYSLVVTAAPTIMVGPATLPDAREGSPYSESITASGGTPGYTCAVTAGAVPPGMTLAADCTLSGTPTARGSYSFTVTVTDANGYTSSRTFTFTVSEPLGATPNDPVPTLDPGAPITPFTPVAPTGGVGPFTYEIAPALPAGLVFDPATGSISGTPTEGKPMTTYTVTITDSLGAKASQDFSMAVVVYSIDLTPATVDVGRAGLPADAQFEGTGGVGPYVIALESGALPPGLTLGSDGHLTGTPTQAGTFVVQLRVTDANGVTALKTITLTVDDPRPDPTRDAGVRALLEGQADSLRRFGLAQTQNAARRLESLRGCSSSRNDLNVSLGEQGTLGASQVARQARDANCEQTRAVWVGGTIAYTDAGPGGPNDLVTDGLTVGMDFRVAENLTLGAGLGLSREGEKKLAGDSTLSGDGYNALAYASWEAMPRFFVEGVVGYGTASYDNRRLVAEEGVFASASRDASHWFASAGIAGVVEFHGASVQPYLRADYQAADLDQYTEHSAGTLALAYDDASMDTTRYTAGLRANWTLPMTFGTVEPLLRVEYRGERRSGLDQAMRYADGLDGIDYTLRTDSGDESSGIAGAGLGVRWLRGISAEIEYQTSFGSSMPQEQSLAAHLNWSF